MAKIYVKVAHPLAQFSQDVVNDKGELVHEHIFAPTDSRTGQQVPAPMQVTRSHAVTLALREPLRLVECTPEEVEAFLAGRPSSEAGGGLGHREQYQSQQHATRPMRPVAPEL